MIAFVMQSRDQQADTGRRSAILSGAGEAIDTGSDALTDKS